MQLTAVASLGQNILRAINNMKNKFKKVVFMICRMARAKRVKQRRLHGATNIIGRVEKTIDHSLSGREYRKCPYCLCTNTRQHPISYSDVATDLSGYKDDLRDFAKVADITEPVLSGEFRATEFICNNSSCNNSSCNNSSCNKSGVVIYATATKKTRFFYHY